MIMKEKFLTLISVLVLGISSAMAQNTITASGKVISNDDGEPIIGASVLVEGTTRGTITDINGGFTIANVDASATLKVSYVGMQTATVKVGRNLTIALKTDAKVLDEVVVTALGIQRQAKAIGYSTAKVNNDQLTIAKSPDPTLALSGKVSGLQVNATSSNLDQETKIQLRGSRSFSGDNSALLVLDGVITPLNFLQTINPNDIDNISVLKGASAAALYGSEAANGVLIVTTKAGGEKGKPTITYGITTTFTSLSYFPKTQHRFGAGHTNNTGASGSATFLYGGYTSDENQQYGPEFDGLDIYIGSPLSDGSYITVPYSYVKNGRENFYETGVGIQHDFSYSASDERGSMFLSYQRLDQTGVVSGDETDRQTVRFNGTRKYKNLTVGAKVSYSHTTYDVASSSSGMWYLMNVAGNVDISDYKNWRVENGSGASPNEWINDYYDNPYFLNDTNRRETRMDRLVGSVDLSYKPTKWLELVGRTGLTLGVNNTSLTTEAFHYSDWAAENIYGASTDQYGSYATASRLRSKFSFDVMALFNHKLSDDFDFKAMVGYSLQDNYMEYKYVEAGTLILDGLYNLSNVSGELSGSNEWERTRKTGLYASVDLSYRDWAFLQVTGRNDWTSLLAPGNRSFFYPSVNASVVLTDAIPKLKSDVLNHMKVRASFARVGTVNVDAYSLENTASLNSYFPYSSLTAYSLNTEIYSSDLKPEFTNEYEVGIELGFLNNRITFEGAAYYQRTTNQTVGVDVATSTGYTTRYINAGTMDSKGIELDLHLTPIIKVGDFSWSLDANATFLKTKVVELAEGADELQLLGTGGVYISAIVGQSYPAISALDLARTSTGKVIVDSETGYPSSGDVVTLGTTQPTVRLGFTSTFRYKTWSLSATFDYRGGHKTYFAIEKNMLFTGTSYLSATAGRQRFVFPNSVIETTDANGNTTYVDNTNVTIEDGGDDFYTGIYYDWTANMVVSAASWRLRELALCFEFPKKWCNAIGFIQNASLSLVGRNLFLWTPSTNVWGDPDYSGYSASSSDITATSINSNITGYAFSGTPPTRSWGFNFQVTF